MTRSNGSLGEQELAVLGRRGRRDLVAGRLQIVVEQRDERGVVLDDENAGGHGSISLVPALGDAAPRAGVVALGAVVGQQLAGDEIVDVLGDIGGVVADALDVLGAEQQMRAQADVARVLHHVGQQLAEHGIVERVEPGVAAPDGERLVVVAAAEAHRARPSAAACASSRHVARGRPSAAWGGSRRRRPAPAWRCSWRGRRSAPGRRRS